MPFSPVRTQSTTCSRCKCSDKKLEESTEKKMWAVIICKDACVLILCNLHCSATQQLSLFLALAGPILCCQKHMKTGNGVHCTNPIFAFNYSLLQNAHCTLVAELFARSRKSNTALQHTLPKGEGLGWAIVRTPQIRVTLAFLAACTDIKCRCSSTRALSCL